MQKKILIFFLIFFSSFSFLFSSSYYIGKGMQGKRLAVYDPEFKNLTNGEKAYLEDLVLLFRVYLRDYAGFDIIDVQNLNKIQALQAESESSKYDDKTAIIAGKLQFAEYEAFITVTKTGNAYSLHLSITDLTKQNAFAEDIVKNIKKITDVSDVGVRKLIAKIVPKTGVQLTSMGKYSLQVESLDNISIEQELNFAKQEEKNLEDTLKKLNKELSNFSLSDKSSDLDSVAHKAQLEVDRELAQHRLRITQQNAERLQQQRNNEIKEKAKDAERSIELREKINLLSDDVEKVAHEIKIQKFDSLSFFEQIKVIEKEKKAYLELKDKIESEVQNLYINMEKEYEKQKIDINDITQYKVAEKSGGVPTEGAKQIRIKKNKEIYNSLLAQTKENEKKLRNQSKINEILNDIEKKEKEIKKTQTLNSFTDQNLLEVEEYDGEKKSWTANVKIILDGKIFIQDSFDIKFNNLTRAINKKSYFPDDMSGKNLSRLDSYNSYIDDVETYDSLFRMGTPLAFLELDISVEPLSKDNPSSYSIKILEYRLKATTTKKIIASGFSNKSEILSLKPAYDMRTFEEKQKHQLSLENEQKIKQKIQQENEIRQLENARRKQIQDAKIATSKSLVRNKMPIYIGYTTGTIDTLNLGFSYEFGKPFLIGTDFNFYWPLNESFKFDYIFDFGFRVGLYKYLPILNYPCIFASAGLGMKYYSYYTSDSSSSYYYNSKEEKSDFGFYVLAEVGLDLPMKSSGLILKYQIEYETNHMYYSNKFIAGINFNLAR